LKSDIELLGTYKDVNIYRYKYVWDNNTSYVGVMAQELLESKYRDVVELDDTGYYKVNYEKLSERT
jgi:IMP cyclohydrolase